MRQALTRAGFKPELMKGDDFCERMLRSVMAATENRQEDSFVPFQGKLDVTPRMEDNGSLVIEFSSDEKEGQFDYRGSLVIDLHQFNPTWFRTTARTLVKATRERPGIIMKLKDDSLKASANLPLSINIEYAPPEELWSLPKVEKADALLVKMLDNLEPWLQDR